jgi:predicted metal-dependent HD superfamily phosphohydrolase
VTGDPLAWYERLIALYSEGHRHYHTLQHLSECLREFDSAKSAAHDPVALELAIWFHDAVYDPRASDNEERSAELARECLQAAPDLATGVGRLVLDTKTHVGSGHPDSPLLIDIDLSIFGQSETRFDEYERQIREEYSWVPGIIFKPKRAAILRGFLDRPRIYNTEMFLPKYEQAARANIVRSVGK